MKLLSDKLCAALCYQVGHEIHNATIYLHLSGILKSKGLDNIAGIFEKQWSEELEHAKMFFDLITDLNAVPVIPTVPEANITVGSIGDIARVYMDAEIITTKSIDEILKLSISDNNPIVEQRCREMIKLQQNEYEEATTFQDRANLLAEWWQVALWDASLH